MENNQHQVKDFTKPRRMSKSALAVICYHQLKRFTSFFFLIVFLKSFNPETQPFLVIIGKLLLILGGLVTLALVLGYLDYRSKMFYVKDGNLIFMHGIFHREITNIPVYKIQSTRTKRGIIYRLLDMKGVSFDTLAAKEAEIELILDDADWDALLQLVEIQEQNLQGFVEEQGLKQEITQNKEYEKSPNQMQIQQTAESITDAQTTVHHSELHHNLAGHYQIVKFSNLNLIKGAFCQNHLKGMAVLGSAILALYGQVSQYSDKAIIYAFDYIEAKTPGISFSLTVFILMLIAFYFMVMILWIGKVFLRYFNMEVRMDQTQLFFESGLFTRLSSQFAYDKVCTVYVKQNLLEKWIKCCTLNLKQAFNATDNKNESDVKIYGSSAANHFLDWWLGKDFSTSKEIISAHSGYGLLGFTIRFDVVITLTALITLGYFSEFVWMILPTIYILISLAKGICAVKRSSITLKDDYCTISNGQFANIQNYIKYSNIEVVRLVRTPFKIGRAHV